MKGFLEIDFKEPFQVGRTFFYYKKINDSFRIMILKELNYTSNCVIQIESILGRIFFKYYETRAEVVRINYIHIYIDRIVQQKESVPGDY